VASVALGLLVLAGHALRQQPWATLAWWEYLLLVVAVVGYLGTLVEVLVRARGKPAFA
jgi:hypothetical protein